MSHSSINSSGQHKARRVIESFLAQFPDLYGLIPDRFQSAENHAISEVAEHQPYTLRNARGTSAFAQALYGIGVDLGTMEFTVEDIQGQVRFRHSSGWRLLIARGQHVGGDTFRVGEKGDLTKHLINHNASALGLILTLFPESEVEPERSEIRNLWALVEKRGETGISVYLLYPSQISDDGTVIRCAEWLHMGDRVLSRGDVASMDVPPPAKKVDDFHVDTREAQGQ